MQTLLHLLYLHGSAMKDIMGIRAKAYLTGRHLYPLVASLALLERENPIITLQGITTKPTNDCTAV